VSVTLIPDRRDRYPVSTTAGRGGRPGPAVTPKRLTAATDAGGEPFAGTAEGSGS
jgi:hypothetical protein